jgi:GntR family transcriptional regulator, transcriptional repressor for pyruvate dehydrogenase complex
LDKPLNSPIKNLQESSFIKSIKLTDGLLSTQTAQQIIDMIKSGDLKEGEQLPSEREFCERLGVSRTVVREAIKLLKASGIVRVRLGIGTFIAESSMNILEIPLSFSSETDQKKISDLQEVREVIEPTIAALAAIHARADSILKMDQSISEMDNQKFNSYPYIQADNNFHIALAEGSNNSVFLLLVNSIVDLLQEARKLAVSSPGAAERANYYHKRILNAIKSKNSQEAFDAMDEHMRQTKGDIQKTLKTRSW